MHAQRLSAVERGVGQEVADRLEPETKLSVEEHLLQPLEILRRVEPVARLEAPRVA